ncbi:MAG: hypothetical protein SF029_24735 [bacterium]|nr:hypothetical protein [bacterium]
MSTDPNQFYQERQRANLQNKLNENANRRTLEVVELEKRAAFDRMPRWQQYIVFALALVGFLAIAYLVLTALF